MTDLSQFATAEADDDDEATKVVNEELDGKRIYRGQDGYKDYVPKREALDKKA